MIKVGVYKLQEKLGEVLCDSSDRLILDGDENFGEFITSLVDEDYPNNQAFVKDLPERLNSYIYAVRLPNVMTGRSDAAEPPPKKATKPRKPEVKTPVVDPTINKFGQILKNVIYSVFEKPLKLHAFDLDEKGGIEGVFSGEGEMYNFTISPEGRFKYIEANSTETKKDSLIDAGFLAVCGKEVYFRFDKSPSGPKCTVGKKCGSTCIEKGRACVIELGPKAKAAVGTLRNEISAFQRKGGKLPGATIESAQTSMSQQPAAQPKSEPDQKEGSSEAGATKLPENEGQTEVKSEAAQKTAGDKKSGESSRQSAIPDGVKTASLAIVPVALAVGAAYIAQDPEGSQAALIDLYQDTMNATGLRRLIPQFQTAMEKEKYKDLDIEKESSKAMAASMLQARGEIAAGSKVNDTKFSTPEERLEYMAKLVDDPLRAEDYKFSLALFNKRKDVPPYPEELAALRYYSDTVGYKEMNMTMRGQTEQLMGWLKNQPWRKGDKRSVEQVTSDAKADIRMVTSALNRLPSFKGETYRGLTLPDDVIESMESGGTWTESGFTSTTKNPFGRYPGNVMMVIKSKEGKDISEFEKYNNAEVLFKPNSSFRITEKRKVQRFGREFWMVKMEEARSDRATDRVSGNPSKEDITRPNKPRTDSIRVDAEQPADRAEAKRRLAKMMTAVINRVYTQGIDRIVRLNVEDAASITGVFQDEDRAFEFDYNPTGTLTYKLYKPDRRDSLVESVLLARSDAIKSGKRGARKKKCTIGINCGGTCIQSTDVCRLRTSEIASKSETDQIMKLAQEVNPLSSRTELAGKTIRELKKEAATRGVYRYSYMTKQQLVNSIQAAEEDPQQQERLRKTLANKKAARDIVQGGSLAKYVKSWQQFERYIKMAGVNKQVAAAAIAALAMGVSLKTYNDIRDKYQNGFQESARTALVRAEKFPVRNITKSNITFAVGGFAGEDSSGAKLKDRLLALADKDDAEMADRWFRDQNDILPFDNKQFDIPEARMSKKDANGNYNPGYLWHLTSNGFGSFMRNYREGRSDAAVDLAAQIYAYANATNSNGRLVNKYKPINVIAHSAGGLTAREATEIIARMPNGARVLDKINLVTLGTPDFGFTNKNLVRELNITSGKDPLSILPMRQPKRIDAIPGREVDDFMRTPEAVEQIRQQFGYYKTSTYFQEARLQRLAEQRATRPAAKRKVQPKTVTPTQEKATPTKTATEAPAQSEGGKLPPPVKKSQKAPKTDKTQNK